MSEIPVGSERGRLMNDRVGPHRCHRCANGSRVKKIEHDGFGTKRAQAFALLGRARRADDGMTPFEQLGDKPQTDCAASARNEDAHLELSY